MKEALQHASFISGGGTTMEAILKAQHAGHIPGLRTALVVVSKPDAGGIKKALGQELPQQNIVVIEPKHYKTLDGKLDSEAFGEALLHELHKREIEVVTQNGWLPLTPANVIDAYQGKIFNQHPGPLPWFGGKGMYGSRVHAAVMLYHALAETSPEEQATEVVSHIVTPKFDEGDVVMSERLTIAPQDTVETLQKRALEVEHRVQIELLRQVVHGVIGLERYMPSIKEPVNQTKLEMAKKGAVRLYPKG